MKGSNSLQTKSYSNKESSGLSSGLTECSQFESDATLADASLNTSGNNGFTRQVKGQLATKSASSKGKSFTVEGCK